MACSQLPCYYQHYPGCPSKAELCPVRQSHVTVWPCMINLLHCTGPVPSHSTYVGSCVTPSHPQAWVLWEGVLVIATVLNKPPWTVWVCLWLVPRQQSGLPASGLGESSACHVLGLSPAKAGPLAWPLRVILATCSSNSSGVLSTGSSLLP